MGSTWISPGADGILGKLPTKVWEKSRLTLSKALLDEVTLEYH